MTAMDEPEPLALLDDLLGRAKRGGADQADAMLVRSAGQSATWRLGKLDQVERSEAAEVGLRVLIGQKQGIVASGDLSKDGLDKLVERTLAIARAVPEDRYAGLAGADEIAREPADLDLDDGEEPASEALAEAAAEVEDAARAEPRITNSEGASAGWSRTQIFLAASNGFVGHSARSSHSLGVSVIAGANGAMERDYEYAVRIRLADLPAADALGRKAADRTVRRLNPKKVRSQQVPVVYDPRVAGSLLRHLISAISGPAVARGTTYLKDRLGEPVFAPGITIIEDPARPLGLRSRSFDAEGIAPVRRPLVEDGVLTTWLLDCASARQLGLRTTGHASRGPSSGPSPAPSNVWLEPTDRTPDELIADIDQGFYVIEMLGMGINPVTGDYSRGAAGFWIEHGEITHPVSGVTIAGNLLDMFKRVQPAGDLEFRYGIDAPTVRIDGMTVAGQ
jgi:PmbA protein